MVNRESVEELARRICRELYEFTDGQPNKSRRIVGGDLMHKDGRRFSRASQRMPKQPRM
jgi:hypothetical protein